MDRLNKTSTSEAFSLHAEEYDRWFDAFSGRMLFDAEVKAVPLLMKNLSPPFLEIGVGSGRFARALGFRYGIDPLDALLEKARKRGIKHLVRIFHSQTASSAVSSSSSLYVLLKYP